MILRKNTISGVFRACKGFQNVSDIVTAMQRLVEQGAVLGNHQQIEYGKDQAHKLIFVPFDGNVEDFVHQRNRVVRDAYR